MEYRYLGNSGLKVSEITYGNWLTHASQVENDAAIACVRAALDVGISTFDTADVYANTGPRPSSARRSRGSGASPSRSPRRSSVRPARRGTTTPG